MIRSRTQWVTEGEKPSKYFCALEQGNYVYKTIKHLQKQDKKYKRGQNQILNEINASMLTCLEKIQKLKNSILITI